MVVLKRTSVRASSVPVGYIGDRASSDAPSYLIDVSQNAAARRISNAARDDTDALMSASKRHDRELLSDINNRLANASFQQPVTIRRSSVSMQRNKPPLPPSGPAASRATVTATTQRGGGGYPLLGHRRYIDDDDEINLVPPTPVTTSVIRSSRAASVPPRLSTGSALPVLGRYSGPPPASGVYLTTAIDGLVTPRTKVTPPWAGHKYITRQQLQQYGLDDPSRYVVDNHKPALLSPVADLAIRQAHRNLDRIDREMKFSSADQTNDTQKSFYMEDDYGQPVVRRTTYRTVTGGSPLAPVTTGYRSSLRTTSLSPARPSYQQQQQQRRRYVSPSPTRTLLTTSGDVITDGLSPLQQLASGPAIEQEIKAQLYKPVRSEVVEMQLFPTEMYKTRAQPLPYDGYVVINSGSSSNNPSHYLHASSILNSLPHPPPPATTAYSRSSYMATTPGVGFPYTPKSHHLRQETVAPVPRTVFVGPDSSVTSVDSSPLTLPLTTSYSFDLPSSRSVAAHSYNLPPAAVPTRYISYTGAGDLTRKSLPPVVGHQWDRSQTLESAPIPQPSSGRPKLSETRRKVREVLCKVKNDPHYFD